MTFFPTPLELPEYFQPNLILSSKTNPFVRSSEHPSLSPLTIYTYLAISFYSFFFLNGPGHISIYCKLPSILFGSRWASSQSAG